MVDATGRFAPREVVEAHLIGVSLPAAANPSFDRVAGALDWLLEQLDLNPRAVRGYLLRGHGLYGRVRIDVYRVDQRAMIVTGEEDLAAAVRRLLPCRSWWQRLLSTPGRPAETLSPWLPNRILNALLREQLTTVEQLAAVPDAALLTIRGLGASSVQPIREAITAAAGPVANKHGWPLLSLAYEQQRELMALLSILTDHARALDDQDTADRAQEFLTHTLNVAARAYARRPGQAVGSP